MDGDLSSSVPRTPTASIAALAVIGFERGKTADDVAGDLQSYLRATRASEADLASAARLIGTWTSLRATTEPKLQIASRVRQLNARLAARELLEKLLHERQSNRFR